MGLEPIAVVANAREGTDVDLHMGSLSAGETADQHGRNASDYGVSVVTVNEIRSNKTWSHLPHAIRRRPPRGILSAEKARAIRADNRSSASIAKDYGVTPGTIRSVKCGMIWKDA